jgi:hypothetical protein
MKGRRADPTSRRALPSAGQPSSMGAGSLPTEGLSEDPVEYRRRLERQSDEQLDSWAGELMRDMSIRRGVLPVLDSFRDATKLDDRAVERTYAAGGGAPATVGRTSDGRLMVPAISLRYLVPGLRAQSPTARGQLIDLLVAGFHEVVYI